MPRGPKGEKRPDKEDYLRDQLAKARNELRRYESGDLRGARDRGDPEEAIRELKVQITTLEQAIGKGKKGDASRS
jgi:hypothetical protein